MIGGDIDSERAGTLTGSSLSKPVEKDGTVDLLGKPGLYLSTLFSSGDHNGGLDMSRKLWISLGQLLHDLGDLSCSLDKENKSELWDVAVSGLPIVNVVESGGGGGDGLRRAGESLLLVIVASGVIGGKYISTAAF